MKKSFARPLITFVLVTVCIAAPLHAQAPDGSVNPVALPALVSEILAKNPEKAFYEAEIAATKAGARSAAARSDPELSVELGRKRVKAPGGALLGEGNAWSVSISQSFEWPGRLALRKSIANGDIEVAELGLSRFQQALNARALTLAYGLHAAAQKADTLREVADRFEQLKETFLARDPAGVTPLLETRVIEANELALQRRVTTAELELQSALFELNQLRGIPPDSPLRITVSKLKLNDPPQADVLLAAARENNLDFRIRQLEVEQQGFHVRLARNERYPSISVSPFVSQENANERETVVGLGFRVPLPISSRGRSGVAAAEARRQQAETLLRVAERELERDVLTTAHAFSVKLAETRRWTADALTSFRDSAALADRHYRLGAVLISTYIEVQNSYLDAVEALLETEREALIAGLKLQQITGVDFRAVEVLP